MGEHPSVRPGFRRARLEHTLSQDGRHAVAAEQDLGILVVAAADDLGLVPVGFGACVR